jgi:hypothetical protein
MKMMETKYRKKKENLFSLKKKSELRKVFIVYD